MAKMAVVTVSGKAYYRLVNELKKRKIDFLSLTPHQSVPLDVEVVITTAPEKHLVQHRRILVYKETTDPAVVIDEAVRLIGGRKHDETVVIGIDPGKTFGLAVLSDGDVIETITCLSVDETLNSVLNALRKLQSPNRIVKVGSGAPLIATELLPLLDKALPPDVAIEIVNEAGTSRFMGENLHKRGSRDAFSAMKIAERRGRPYQRKEELRLK